MELDNVNFVTFLVSVPNKFQGICLDSFFFGFFNVVKIFLFRTWF